jgi:hypothetical protein
MNNLLNFIPDQNGLLLIGFMGVVAVVLVLLAFMGVIDPDRWSL